MHAHSAVAKKPIESTRLFLSWDRVNLIVSVEEVVGDVEIEEGFGLLLSVLERS